jgi:hypothetical protein
VEAIEVANKEPATSGDCVYTSTLRFDILMKRASKKANISPPTAFRYVF